MLGRARRRGRSVCLLRPPGEIECQTNSREIDEHTPVHSDTPRVADKVAFQALGTRHILTNGVLSLTKRCGQLILCPMCAVGQSRKNEDTNPHSDKRFLWPDQHVPGSDAFRSDTPARCERHNRTGMARPVGTRWLM